MYIDLVSILYYEFLPVSPDWLTFVPSSSSMTCKVKVTLVFRRPNGPFRSSSRSARPPPSVCSTSSLSSIMNSSSTSMEKSKTRKCWFELKFLRKGQQYYHMIHRKPPLRKVWTKFGICNDRWLVRSSISFEWKFGNVFKWRSDCQYLLNKSMLMNITDSQIISIFRMRAGPVM